MDVQWVCSTLSLLSVIGALSSGDDGWYTKVQPEVRAIEGYPVVLPCTFSHPQHSQHSSLQVLWRLGHGQDSTVLYRCSSGPGAPTCEPGPQQDRRYRLEGNPREHDLSLRISSAALQDSGRYYCRVEIQGREHISFEDKMGTRLRVEAPPRILDLSVEGSDQSGYRALCRVQGSPLPDVQWLGPDDPLVGSLVGSPVVPLAQGSAAHFHTVSQLRDVEPDRRYVCSASNPLGKEQAALYVLHPRPPLYVGGASPLLLLLLSLSVGAKLLLLVGVGVWMVQGGALQGLGCRWKLMMAHWPSCTVSGSPSSQLVSWTGAPFSQYHSPEWELRRMPIQTSCRPSFLVWRILSEICFWSRASGKLTSSSFWSLQDSGSVDPGYRRYEVLLDQFVELAAASSSRRRPEHVDTPESPSR
ncbi:sialic acid-binding Ig-like lectin 15 [Anarrhichthys ocellatus]|uniref:sialic acid-binding Ig-like lectin 15 n=1 Tax=Anarrhichthys ocellatus TaxID=433405 RepID=UPI0012ECE8FF|nr:sialic acid-binding Ig-like lectin 15 [Anarrhichthys ocellatus]